MRFQTHRSYKPSGVEWLTDVPQHWNIIRFKYLCARSALYGANISSDDYTREGVRFLRTTDITDSGNLLSEGVFIDSHDAAGYLLKDGDILVSRSGTLGRTFIFRQREDAAYAYAGYLVRFVPSPKLNPQFFFYYSKCIAFKDWLQTQIISSTIGNVNGQKYAQCPLPDPPRVEQDAIADFLDTKTAKLDVLIAKKRELIEKLKEKRTTLISRTVARGLPPEPARAARLNPSPTLKPSGIGWIGAVPSHWEVGNLRRYAQMKTGHTPSRENADYWENCTIPWFTLADVWQLRDDRRKYLGETKEKISEAGLKNSAAELLPSGTVILSRTASVGFSGIMPVPMATTQDFWNWICGKKLTPEYLLLLFRSMKQDFTRLTMGSTHKTIYQPDAASFVVCVPPIPEQEAIIGYLESETAKIDDLIDKVEAAIERLEEYRNALITAAVTGKIDVRKIAA